MNNETTTPQPDQSSNKTTYVVLVVIAIVIGLVVWFYPSLISAPSSSPESSSTSVNSQDYPADITDELNNILDTSAVLDQDLDVIEASIIGL